MSPLLAQPALAHPRPTSPLVPLSLCTAALHKLSYSSLINQRGAAKDYWGHADRAGLALEFGSRRHLLSRFLNVYLCWYVVFVRSSGRGRAGGGYAPPVRSLLHSCYVSLNVALRWLSLFLWASPTILKPLWHRVPPQA